MEKIITSPFFNKDLGGVGFQLCNVLQSECGAWDFPSKKKKNKIIKSKFIFMGLWKPQEVTKCDYKFEDENPAWVQPRLNLAFSWVLKPS